MAIKYKIWLNIEKIDEDKDIYEDIESEINSIGPEFDSLKKAQTLKERLLEVVTNNGEVVWMPPIADVCPRCKSELMGGPNGSTICSKNGCNYWRE